MVYCSIAGCKNRPDTSEKKLRFYSFPKDDRISKLWVKACGKKKSFKIECARICSVHFVQSDFKLQDILLKVPEHKRRLRNGAAPSENLPKQKLVSFQEINRKKQENKALVEECLASYERKQNEMSSASSEKYRRIQANKVSSGECLSSYVSTFLSTELPSSEEKSHENGSLSALCADPLESIYLASHVLPSFRSKKRGKRKNSNLTADCIASGDLNSHSTDKPEKCLEEHSYSNIKYFTNGSTQTEFDYGCCKELHIMRLEAQNRRLTAALKKQTKRTQENEAIRSSLRSMMTMGQINRLLHPGRNLKWKAEDIASAMSLYSAGPAVYALLRRKNFPLPSSSTLRGWAGKIEIKPGILENVIQLMSKMNYDEKERLCVLCFNKIKLKSSSYSDKSNNMAMSRAKYAHVVMVRGLVKDWTQIIYYALDVPITASILRSIIVQLEGINFTVTAVVSDMGLTIAGLLEELCISENHPFFLHPCDGLRKVFFFIDVLHLIKLLRNRFIDTGFAFDGKTINTEPIKEILEHNKCELRISYEHLDMNKVVRRKVDLATQLLSHSVSAAIMRCISLGKIQSSNAFECADFIKTVSDWFELFNSKNASIDSKEKKTYGLALEIQKNILTLMSQTIRHINAPKRKTVLRFQNGILLNNAALPQMLDYVTKQYNITYILTERLHHEELESIFNSIRPKGALQDHPTPLEFKYRLRSLLLGKMIL